ncbi:aminotransferase class IV [Pontibacter vulgaris]|uniref:aminotransferase class IV n=1 Tax=Pontibacter vulgaris TaxID=2905679 RepID=UPI001FA7B99C|nr:aminotransferase class IV [Pontibacter vulgaris]
MYLLYNGECIPENELRMPLNNRAFQFNDGFFETIILDKGTLRFWPDHLARMQSAAQSLQMQLPSFFASTSLEKQLLQLAEQNQLIDKGRLKLKVWRAGAGLYTPETNDIEWLATISPVQTTIQQALQIGVCRNVFTNHSPLSYFKGPNALLYVLAGIEKKEQNYDDMLLLNRQGIVSELISSNIFWLKEEVLHTPALDTGCVNGIARRNILRWCTNQSIKVKEVYFNPDKLQHADAVFAANVTGIRSIASINRVEIKTDQAFIDKMQQAIFS